MPLDRQIRTRHGQLMAQAFAFLDLTNVVMWSFPTYVIQVEAWLTSASAMIELLAPKTFGPHRTQLTIAMLEQDLKRRVQKVAGVLAAAEADLSAGVVGIEVIVQAELFDDLLTQAEASLKRPKGLSMAAVVVGVVFEDTLRRIMSLKQLIVDPKDTADPLVTKLKDARVFEEPMAARCRAAAAVRNKALHAKWGEFTKDDVEAALKTSRELIRDHLAI